jgi:cytochrome c553
MTRTIALLALCALSTAAVAAGNADRGAEKAKQVCAACHGADGNTPLQAEYPRLAGQHEDYIYKALRDYKSGARKNAIMGAQAANLSRQEMQDLATYFSSQKGPLGTIR